MTDAAFWARMDVLATRLEPALALVYGRALARLRDRIVIAPLVRMLDSGDINGALAYLFDTPEAKAILRDLELEYATAVVRTIPSVERLLPRLPGALSIRVRAPVASPAITDALARWHNDTFRRVVTEMRAGVRAAVADGVADGLGPRAIAVALKAPTSAIGLTAYDEGLIRSYRQQIESKQFATARARALGHRRYDKMLARGDVTPAQVDKMVAAYRQKLVAFRAETFARTAAIQAANDANRASWEQAIADGVYPYDEVRAYWVVAQDERLCVRCEDVPDLNPDGRKLRELFATPQDGEVRGPTLHPRCRCTLAIRHESPLFTRRPAPGTTRFVFTAVDLRTSR